jgi:hypothetical protein
MDPEQYFHGIDDVDIAFARLERVPPPERLHGSVMLAVAARARARRRMGYLLIASVLVVAVALSFFLGQQLRVSGALDLASVALANLDLFLDAPGEFVLAFGEGVPWLLVLPVVLCVGAIAWATRLALTPSVRMRAPNVGR